MSNPVNDMGLFLQSKFTGGCMLEKISHKFHSWAKGWLVIVLILLDGFMMGFVMPLVGNLLKSGTGTQHPIDLQFFSTPAKLFEMVASYGEYGRPFYRNMELTVDILHPIIYTLALGLCISWLFQRGFQPDSRMQKLNVLPLGAWLFDLLENLGIVILLSTFPAQPTAIAWLTTIFTMVKWVFAGVSVALVIIGIVAAAKHGFRKRE